MIDIPVTYYLEKLYMAPINKADALYFEINVCEKGIANQKQAELSISVPDNVHWNTTAEGYVVVQVSKCKDSFTSECVFATNYKYASHPEAEAVISWNISITNETTYYLRVMGINKPTSFSMELSFGNDYSGRSFEWTTDKPFDGEIPTTPIQNLVQYWRADAQYEVQNDAYKQFSLAYCPQSGINGIDVAVSTLPNEKDEFMSLIQQWGCTQATNVNDCTTTNYDWYNQHWAGFDLLHCDSKIAPTANGIYIIVQGGGSNLDESNTFVVTATTF